MYFRVVETNSDNFRKSVKFFKNKDLICKFIKINNSVAEIKIINKELLSNEFKKFIESYIFDNKICINNRILSSLGVVFIGKEIFEIKDLYRKDPIVFNEKLIDLAACGLKKIPNIKTEGDINLSHNEIKEINSFVCNLKGSLNLSYNKIKGIPEGFTQSAHLDLSNNKIKRIPNGFKQKDSLNISHNLISELPKGFKVNHSLNLSGNNFFKFPSVVQNAPIDLSSNNIKKIPNEFELRSVLNIKNNPLAYIPEHVFNYSGKFDNSDIQILFDYQRASEIQENFGKEEIVDLGIEFD